jgi:hypothetical protein
MPLELPRQRSVQISDALHFSYRSRPILASAVVLGHARVSLFDARQIGRANSDDRRFARSGFEDTQPNRRAAGNHVDDGIDPWADHDVLQTVGG